MKTFAIPTKLINELVEIMHETKDFGLRSLIKNACEEILSIHDYDHFCEILSILEKDYPNLIDYKNAFLQVKKCQTRYNNI